MKVATLMSSSGEDLVRSVPGIFAVRLRGGLGNQMFQYAFGRSLAGNRALLFDDSEMKTDRIRELELSRFGIDLTMGSFPPLVDRIVRVPGMWRMIKMVRGRIPVPGGQLIWDDMAGFDPRWSRIRGTVYAMGYWQSSRYFDSMRGDLLDAFTPKSELSDESRFLLSESHDAVGVQIRRGDYLDPSVSAIHPSPSRDYFSSAVRCVVERTGIRKAIVCTDDLEWAIAHVTLPVEQIFFRTRETQAWEDMSVLRSCAHIVISNSSFGWWSAWLAGRNRVVVCPEQWFGRKGRSFASPVDSDWIQI